MPQRQAGSPGSPELRAAVLWPRRQPPSQNFYPGGFAVGQNDSMCNRSSICLRQVSLLADPNANPLRGLRRYFSSQRKYSGQGHIRMPAGAHIVSWVGKRVTDSWNRAKSQTNASRNDSRQASFHQWKVARLGIPLERQRIGSLRQGRAPTTRRLQFGIW